MNRQSEIRQKTVYTTESKQNAEAENDTKKKTNTKETIRQRSADIIYTYTEADERHRDRVTDLSLFSEPPTKSKTRSDDIFTDILWSDPRPITGREKSDRGAGVHFGLDVTRK